MDIQMRKRLDAEQSGKDQARAEAGAKSSANMSSVQKELHGLERSHKQLDKKITRLSADLNAKFDAIFSLLGGQQSDLKLPEYESEVDTPTSRTRTQTRSRGESMDSCGDASIGRTTPAAFESYSGEGRGGDSEPRMVVGGKTNEVLADLQRIVTNELQDSQEEMHTLKTAMDSTMSAIKSMDGCASNSMDATQELSTVGHTVLSLRDIREGELHMVTQPQVQLVGKGNSDALMVDVPDDARPARTHFDSFDLIDELTHASASKRRVSFRDTKDRRESYVSDITTTDSFDDPIPSQRRRSSAGRLLHSLLDPLTGSSHHIVHVASPSNNPDDDPNSPGTPASGVGVTWQPSSRRSSRGGSTPEMMDSPAALAIRRKSVGSTAAGSGSSNVPASAVFVDAVDAAGPADRDRASLGSNGTDAASMVPTNTYPYIHTTENSNSSATGGGSVGGGANSSMLGLAGPSPLRRLSYTKPQLPDVVEGRTEWEDKSTVTAADRGASPDRPTMSTTSGLTGLNPMVTKANSNPSNLPDPTSLATVFRSVDATVGGTQENEGDGHHDQGQLHPSTTSLPSGAEYSAHSPHTDTYGRGMTPSSTPVAKVIGPSATLITNGASVIKVIGPSATLIASNSSRSHLARPRSASESYSSAVSFYPSSPGLTVDSNPSLSSLRQRAHTAGSMSSVAQLGGDEVDGEGTYTFDA